MNEFINTIKLDSIINLVKRRKVKQVGSLYTSMGLGLIIGIGVSVVNARLLGPQQYGDLKFLQTLFTFALTFLTLGIFASGSRLLAQKKNEPIKHQLIGSLLTFTSIISVILIIGFFIFSFFEESIFNNKLGHIIRIFSPLLFVFPFQFCLTTIMEGDNRIYELSIFETAPKILYFLGAMAFNFFIPLSLTSALAIQFLFLLLLILIMVIIFKPKFENLKKNFSIVLQENKTYGFHVYIGVLAGVASAHLGGLSIGYFIDNTNVGFFSLALTTSMPLVMIPETVGTTFFKDFANKKFISKQVTNVTLILSICALLFFLLVIKKVIILLYSAEYSAVVLLAYMVSIGNFFHGFGDYIGKFLGAKGKGKEKRNGAFAVGVSNILGYSFLVYYFGVKGAAITKILSSFVYFAMMVFYYKKVTKGIIRNEI